MSLRPLPESLSSLPQGPQSGSPPKNKLISPEFSPIHNELEQFYHDDLQANVGCLNKMLATQSNIFNTRIPGLINKSLKEVLIPIIFPERGNKTSEELIKAYQREAINTCELHQNFQHLLIEDGKLAEQTGFLLKYIDLFRSLRIFFERPAELSNVWGIEHEKPLVQKKPLSPVTQSLLAQPSQITPEELEMGILGGFKGNYKFKSLLGEITDKDIRTVCSFSLHAALLNARDYKILTGRQSYGKKAISTPIGNGSTPEDDLRHEVLYLFNNILIIKHDENIPSESDIYQPDLSMDQLIDLYMKGIIMLVDQFNDPTKASQTFNNYFSKTGSKMLLGVYRHLSQHAGSLNIYCQREFNFFYQ